jgi:hypothetical protein
MDIIELLKMRDFHINKKEIKLVRHQEKSYDIERLYSMGMISIYQSIQTEPVFRGCSYIISFLGLERTKAKFIGIYKVLAEKRIDEVIIPKEFIYPEMIKEDKYYYELEEVSVLDDLKERLIIEWGRATRTWHQWLIEKEVVEILPDGYCSNFPGFLEFVLSYNDLEKIMKYPDANREWHVMLSSVAGIYLILDTYSGEQYIGSASGANGIMGRWGIYVQNKHGGNEKIKQRLEEDPMRYLQFQYTVLMTLPKTMTKKEVIAYELKYKEKLGTKKFGLNLN